MSKQSGLADAEGAPKGAGWKVAIAPKLRTPVASPDRWIATTLKRVRPAAVRGYLSPRTLQPADRFLVKRPADFFSSAANCRSALSEPPVLALSITTLPWRSITTSCGIRLEKSRFTTCISIWRDWGTEAQEKPTLAA